MEKEPEKAKKLIGFIPDRPFLYDKLTGMEFLRFVADLYGVAENDFLHKAPGLLGKFSLFGVGRRTHRILFPRDEAAPYNLRGASTRPLGPDRGRTHGGPGPRGIRMVKDLSGNCPKRHRGFPFHPHAGNGPGPVPPDRHHPQGRCDRDRDHGRPENDGPREGGRPGGRFPAPDRRGRKAGPMNQTLILLRPRILAQKEAKAPRQ